MTALADSAQRAGVAELCWWDGTAVQAMASVPLVDDGVVTFALPYADLATARAVAAAGRVAVVLSEPRLARSGWEPLTTTSTVEVVEDPDGERFHGAGLLGQLVAVDPASAALLDTPVRRREHWWFLPRLLLRLVAPATPVTVPPRDRPDRAVLGWHADGRVGAAVVAVDGWAPPAVMIADVGGPHPPHGRRIHAAVFTHDFSVPDRDVTTALLLQGTLHEGRLEVDRSRGARVLPSRPSLLRRLGDHRRLERACRDALATTGGQPGGRR